MKAAALAILALLPLTAQAPAPKPGRLALLLDLSPDQQARLRALRATQREALAPKLAVQREARRALAQELRAPDATEARIRALHARAAEAHLEVLLARRADRAALKAVLTPAQQEKAAALRAARGRGR